MTKQPTTTTTTSTPGSGTGAGAGTGTGTGTGSVDPHEWLEDVTGEKQLSWVKEKNAVSQGELEATPGFEALRLRLLSIYDSKDKIPVVGVQGK